MCPVSLMTEHQAERTANIVLGLAAAGAAYYILKTPKLRRLAWGLVRTAAVSTGPALADRRNDARLGWRSRSNTDDRPGI